jgi:hypothetical protein
MTLAQIAEKPITVTTDDAISNFAESRQGRLEGRLVVSFRRPKPIVRSNPKAMRPESLLTA